MAYWTTRNNTNAFKWPDSKALKDDFPDTAEGQKVVLALLPNFIPYGFGAVPQEGPIKEMGDVFAQMDNGPDQGVDLKPIHDAVLLLVKNGGRSFRLTNEPGEDGGVAIGQIDSPILTEVRS